MRRTRIVMLAIWLACFLSAAGAGAQYFSHSYAIVIGIDNYRSSASFPALHYAVKDAQVMASYLASQGFTVTPLYGPAATRAAIISAMQDTLAPKLGHDDRVLVFFSGHGTTETLGGVKRGYIVPYDGSNSSSLISMEELRALSSYMGSAKHQLFIMDSCYGGVLAASTKESVVSPYVAHYLQQVTDRIARQVLTAGGEGQTVLDGGPKGHSVFVDALLEGLQDGLADRDGDGYITFHELVAYVTPRAANDYQTPDPGVLPGDQGGEFLFRNPKGAGRAVSEIPAPADTRRKGFDPVAEAQQYVALGNTRWGVSDWDGAAEQYRKAISVYPNYAEAHNYLGNALGHKGDFDGEIKEVHEAIRLKPDYAVAHAGLGYALGQKGDWDGEIKEESEAIRLKADSAEAHANLGAALGRKGKFEEAIKEEREAIRLKPDLADAHLNLGYALGVKGDLDGKIHEEREAIRIKPDYAVAHANLGAALGQAGDWDGEIKEEREAIRLKPDLAEAHGNLGYALGVKGDLDGKIKEEREDIRLEPDDLAAHLNLGYALEQKGDKQAALAEYRRTLDLEPGNSLAQTHYNSLLKEMNNSPK